MTRTLAPPVVEDGETPGSLAWASGGEGIALGRETMQPLWDFLAAERKGPFFVWYAPLLPHMPFDAPEKFTRLYADVPAPQPVRAYWANMTRFDETVGALMAKLEKLGLRENTLVLYLADNGWDAQATDRVLGGAKGKGSLNELGVRTPMVFSWPGRISSGVRDDRLVSFLDVFPTLLDFARAKATHTSGMSLKPLLLGSGDFHREFVVGGSGLKGIQERFLRTATWRYSTSEKHGEGLYLIERDPREKNNLAEMHPELVEALRRELTRQLSGAPPPRHPRVSRPPKP
jgi:arylsulfatase A-like enzyme